ncbi:Uncharacterised protein [Segatella copri]|nr:Uncharacterised protein [Segatella copri]
MRVVYSVANVRRLLGINGEKSFKRGHKSCSEGFVPLFFSFFACFCPIFGVFLLILQQIEN